MPTHSPNVRVITLGCAKNEVDSEEIAGVLSSSGYRVDGGAENPDVIVINTCGFLESAKKESIEVINQAVALRDAGGAGKVVVAGCLSQRLGDDIAKLAPGADAYVGVGQMGQFDKIVGGTLGGQKATVDIQAPHHKWADVKTRARSGTPWSAYLKVSEGCDHQCTFCTIPSFRGKHESKPMERVLEEARFLAENGVKEINLIAQDVTQYGFDLYKKFTLPKLLEELNAIDGIKWIRILYFYPNRLTDEVIDAMAGLPHVLPYIDIPLQHVHPDTLRRMKRPWDGERYLELFEKVRAKIPEVAIRTTFIVGFPGETDREFDTLIDFVKRSRLDRVGAFHYSKEKGTPSFEMTGQVPFWVKQARYAELMETQQEISLAINESWIGRKIKVLVEQCEGNDFVGRSYRDAPEIDGWVYGKGKAKRGEFVEVEITDAEPYDLYGVSNGFKKQELELKQRKRARPL